MRESNARRGWRTVRSERRSGVACNMRLWHAVTCNTGQEEDHDGCASASIRSGSKASRCAPRGGLAAHSNLGSGRAFTVIRGQGTSSVTRGGKESQRPRGSGIHRRDIRLEFDVRRGEVWAVAGGQDYAGKPRPVVILQDDRFDATQSITICAFTTDPTPAPLFRLLIDPDGRNGLKAPCRLMADKITTVPKSKIGVRLGRLDDEDMVRLNRAVVVFLGLAGASPDSQR